MIMILTFDPGSYFCNFFK